MSDGLKKFVTTVSSGSTILIIGWWVLGYLNEIVPKYKHGYGDSPYGVALFFTWMLFTVITAGITFLIAKSYWEDM